MKYQIRPFFLIPLFLLFTLITISCTPPKPTVTPLEPTPVPSPTPFNYTVTVIDVNGVPIDNAIVQLQSSSGHIINGITDNSGIKILTVLNEILDLPGSLTVSKEGYIIDRREYTIVKGLPAQIQLRKNPTVATPIPDSTSTIPDSPPVDMLVPSPTADSTRASLQAAKEALLLGINEAIENAPLSVPNSVPATPSPIALLAETDLILINPVNLELNDEENCYREWDSNVPFQWEWTRPLSTEGKFIGEYFALRLGLEENGESHSIVWTQDPEYTLEGASGFFDLLPGQVYSWNVAVVEPYADPPHKNWLLVDQGPTHRFRVCAGDGSETASPTPKTDNLQPDPIATTPSPIPTTSSSDNGGGGNNTLPPATATPTQYPNP